MTSLYIAYPVKNLALAFFKDDFIIFEFYGDASPYVYLFYIAFMVILLITINRGGRYSDYSGRVKMFSALAITNTKVVHRVALGLLVINAVVLFWTMYQVNEGQITTLLFTSDARRAFLFNMQGQGWLTLLIFFSLPLVVLQDRNAVKNPIFIIATMMTFFALAAVGSRLFLFGYLLCIIMHFYRLTPLVAGILFVSFVLFGALIYISFAGIGDATVYLGLTYFMRSFDGADLMNGYLETARIIYYGSTLINDVFVTYIPRALWIDKPFNYGSIVITGDMYPELQDVQTLGATYPPGLLLEGFANFSWLCPIFYYAVAQFLVSCSKRSFSDNPYSYALYVSAAATSATIFRGFGQFLVSLIAYVFIILMIYIVVLPFRTIPLDNVRKNWS